MIATILPRLSQDGHRALLLFGIAFFGLGLPRLFTFTAALSLFVDQWGADAVPLTYIGAAVSVPLAGVLYYRLERRLSFAMLLYGVVAVDVAALVVLWGAQILFDHAWVSMSAAVWVEIEWTATNLVFWGLAARLYGPRQSKRWLGLAAAGEPVAMLTAGLAVPVLLRVLGVPDLLLAGAAGQLVAFGLIVAVARSEGAALQGAPGDDEDEAGDGDTTDVPAGTATRRYVILLLALAVLFEIVYFCLDYAFYELAQRRHSNALELAEFFGIFQASVAVLTLVGNLALCRLLLERFGLRAGLGLMPVLLLLGVGGALLGGLAGAAAVVFWTGIATKLTNEAFDGGLYRPALTVLYQALPARLRTRALALTEAVVAPVATGVAGIGLLALAQFAAPGLLAVFTVVAILLPLWLGLVWLAQREYQRTLNRALVRGGLSSESISLGEDETLEVVRGGLRSTHASERVHAMHLLLRHRGEDELTHVLALLGDPESVVRREAARALETHRLDGAFDAIRARLADEPVASVRAALLRASAAMQGERTRPLLLECMNDADVSVQLGAIVGLLRYGGIEGVLAAGDRVLHLVRSPRAADRLLAARVLGEVGVAHYHEPLIALLDDADIDVRRAALQVASALRAPALWPGIVACVHERALRELALGALTAAGPGTLETVASAVASPATPDAVRVDLVCAAIGVDADAGAALLATHLRDVPEATAHRAVIALHASGVTVSTVHRDTLAGLLTRCINRAVDIHRQMATLRDARDCTPALNALSDLFERYRIHAYALLGLLNDAPALRQPWGRTVGAGDGEHAQYAMEILEANVDPALREIVVALLDPHPTGERALRWPGAKEAAPADADVCLEVLARGDQGWTSSWVRACAIFTLGERDVEAARATVTGALRDDDGLVRETALWALERLGTPRLRRVAGALLSDPDERVARRAQEIIMVTR